MSNNPSPYSSEIPENADTTQIKFFAVLVGNEYAGVIGFPNNDNMEAVIAALNSEPTILPLETTAVIHGVKPGWIWDGTSFSSPVE